MIDLNTNLIVYEYSKGQYTLNPVQTSGERDETKVLSNDKLKYSEKDPAILVLENDIVNSKGYGLKKGFYTIEPDKYLDFLLIYQAGKLKAKIPVVKVEVLETLNPKQQKVKKMSYKKFLIEQEKEKRKYYKGENPAEFDYKKAQIHYIDEQNSYVIIYNSKIIELTGVIKF